MSASTAAPAPAPIPASSKPPSKFGQILADNKINLVYGGGSFGLMGALATSVLDHGGTVTGIIPESLVARRGLEKGPGDGGDARHARAQAADVRALGCLRRFPGGIGTLEELVEQLTWAQLAITKSRSCCAASRFLGAPAGNFSRMQATGFFGFGISTTLIFCKTILSRVIQPLLRSFRQTCNKTDRSRK